MATIICGSMAFDTIMTFEGRFADQILPQQLHILNVSFLVPTLRREFGGCAGNIAYGLKLLGGAPLPMATVGADSAGADYLAYMQKLGVDTRHVTVVPNTCTAQAMIMTDRDNNQITAFHPGAMMQAHVNAIPAGEDVRLGIVSPDGRQAMLEHAQQFHDAGIPFVFDPGQGLPMFGRQELLHFLELATWVTVNDYEGKMLSERTGLDPAAISRKVQGYVITLGAQGCAIWSEGQHRHVPPIPVREVVDPTGCGDAWRAAFLYGLEQGWDVPRCAGLGNQMGAAKIINRGPQGYTFDGILDWV